MARVTRTEDAFNAMSAVLGKQKPTFQGAIEERGSGRGRRSERLTAGLRAIVTGAGSVRGRQL